jgi:bifunctional DNA-binding transcriptional regulator/antitoxin component of YhaV-PrlF toxin-antitoxin module
MTTLKITAKGQVTLRKDILRHLGVGPGERIVVGTLPGARIEAIAAPTGKISAVFGLLKRRGPSLTIRRIKEISAKGWAGKE